jgi:hypothetical protein
LNYGALIFEQLAHRANPDVVAIVMPPEVEEECKTIGVEFAAMKIRLTPIQKIQRKFEKVRQSGQELLGLTFDEPDAQDGQTGYWNIHHALKAHAMSSGLTTQVALGKHAPRAEW